VLRHCSRALCLLLAVTANAEAQAASYLVAGGLIELPKRTQTTAGGSEAAAVRGVSLGVGFPLGKASLEFAGFWHSAEVDIDREGATTVSEMRVRNRDVPLVAAIRYQPSCFDKWCAEIGGGFGINFSRRQIERIGLCGTVSLPMSPCTPVTPASFQVIEVSKEEPTFYIGTTVTIVVLQRLEVGPSFRLWYVRRYRDEIGGIVNLRRTPSNERIEIGFNAIWHFKRP
jgi:hypothetical protein